MTTNGTPNWTILPGGSVASIIGAGTLTPTVNVTGSGTVNVRLTTTSTATPNCGTVTDDVALTVNPNPVAAAGVDQTLCQATSGPTAFNLVGTATNGTPVWSVVGTTGGASASIGNTGNASTAVNVTGVGTVTLRLTVTSNATPNCGTATDDIVLNVNPNPTANAGVDQVLCQLATAVAFNLTGTVSNGTPFWTVVNQSPTITSAQVVTPASANTSVNITGFGAVTLRLTTTSNATPACGTASDDVVLTLAQSTIVNAGMDINVPACAASVQLAGSFGGAATSAMWSGGQGSFSPNASVPNAVYIPSAAERNSNATITLTLTTNTPSATCAATSDQVVIHLLPCPQLQLQVRLQEPAPCVGPGGIVTLTTTVINTGTGTQQDNPGPEFSAQLPLQLVGLVGSGTASSGTVIVGPTQVTWNGSIPAGQTITITYQAQVADNVTAGQELCLVSTVFFDADNNGSNESSASVTVCVRTTCTPIGPGSPYPGGSEVSDQKAGSVLFYNIFTSNPSTPNSQNTQLNITNTNQVFSSNVHLFFVDGATCSVADFFICLTRNQTARLLASDLDPGTTGYVVAIAVDSLGCPTNFNSLIGDEYVKFSSGHAANLGAEALAAVAGGPVACDQNSNTAVLNFDGVSYNRLPRVLAVDSLASRADGNDTLLILNRIGGDLGIGAASLSGIFGLLYDDQEVGYSFSLPTGSCQFRSSLSNTTPRTAPRFDTVIPAGRTGWLKLNSQNDQGLLGAVINFNPNAAANAGAFNQGHNLHKLTLTSSATLTIPVFQPNCR